MLHTDNLETDTSEPPAHGQGSLSALIDRAERHAQTTDDPDVARIFLTLRDELAAGIPPTFGGAS